MKMGHFNLQNTYVEYFNFGVEMGTEQDFGSCVKKVIFKIKNKF